VNISGTNISGVAIKTLKSVVTVTGGVKTTDGLYTIRTFTADGTLSITGGTLESVWYLLIAGGGGHPANAGTNRGGAGGAGGFLESAFLFGSRYTENIVPGSYSISIGQGGTANANGGNSTFLTYTAIGGGAGGANGNAGAAGGSGGGGAGRNSGTAYAGGSGTLFQGYDGGAGDVGATAGGGGGGGAGEPGGTDSAQAGGDGLQSAITGTTTYYAGGGGGGIDGSLRPGLGQDNYGGGANTSNTGTNGTGKNGVLIIRYLTEGTA